jgi:hypothetical protein
LCVKCYNKKAEQKRKSKRILKIKPNRIRVCLNCGREKKIHAKELCDDCYRIQRIKNPNRKLKICKKCNRKEKIIDSVWYRKDLCPTCDYREKHPIKAKIMRELYTCPICGIKEKEEDKYSVSTKWIKGMCVICYRKQQYAKNKEKNREDKRIYRINNLEKLKEREHNNYIKFREKKLKNKKEYRQKNPDLIREKNTKRKHGIEIIEHIKRKELLEKFGYKCAFYGICPNCPYDNGQLKDDATTHMAHLLAIARYKKIRKKCPHSWSNVVPMKDVCNIAMHDKTPLEFIWEKLK